MHTEMLQMHNVQIQLS